jgi:hypothetical protein
VGRAPVQVPGPHRARNPIALTLLRPLCLFPLPGRTEPTVLPALQTLRFVGPAPHDAPATFQDQRRTPAVKDRGHWGSKAGFVLAAAGSAIGLGSIWKFPYITGVKGGGAVGLI